MRLCMCECMHMCICDCGYYLNYVEFNKYYNYSFIYINATLY